MPPLSKILRHLTITGKSANENVTFGDLTQMAHDDREAADNDAREKLIADQHTLAQGAAVTQAATVAAVPDFDYDKLAAAMRRQELAEMELATAPPAFGATGTPVVSPPPGDLGSLRVRPDGCIVQVRPVPYGRKKEGPPALSPFVRGQR